MIVVLPDPVGPTIAIFCPGATAKLKSRRTGSPGRYSKFTRSNTMLPCGAAGTLGVVGLTMVWGSSMSASMRSAAASDDCRTVYLLDSSRSGRKNIRAYCMKPIRVPRVIARWST